MKSEDILKRTQDLLGAKAQEKESQKSQLENERRLLITSLAQDISSIIQPTLENMIQANQVTIDSLKQAMREIKVDVPKTEVRMPTINVPRPSVSVNVPEFKMPQMNIPPPVVNFPDRMSVSMDAVDNKSPLPVMMMGGDGKPMTFSMGAGGGGKADFFTIKDIKNSSGGSLINDEGNLKIAGSFSVTASNSSTQAIDSSGEVYSRANPMPVYDMSGASGSVASSLIDSSGVQYSGSNPLPVTITSGGTATSASNIVDSTGVAYTGSNPVPVSLISGSLTSTGAYLLNGDGTYRDTMPVSGTVTVSAITASTAVANIDSTGVQYSGSNPFPMRVVTDATATVNVVNVDSTGAYRATFPITGAVTISGISGTSAVNLSDSTGIGYSGSNPVPVTMVTSSVVSTITVGPVAEDAVDDGSAPVQVGGTARTTNPTAVANGDVVKSSYDDIGRILTRPVQVRDLMQTAYVSLTTGTETTLLAGSAGIFHDLVYVMGANNSDVAVSVDIRPVTAGNIVMTLQIPASGTAGVSLPIPLPQSGSDTGNNWTADMGDITGTTVALSALFSKEV
jgi:hypothetical protein